VASAPLAPLVVPLAGIFFQNADHTNLNETITNKFIINETTLNEK